MCQSCGASIDFSSKVTPIRDVVTVNYSTEMFYIIGPYLDT